MVPQFRLSAKLAKVLMVGKLKEPNATVALYNDWYLNIIKVRRKNIYFFVHVKTKVTLAIPNDAIDNVSNFPKHFALMLKNYLTTLHFEEMAIEAYNFFCKPPQQMFFVKPNNCAAPHHIFDFKRELTYHIKKGGKIDQELCNEITSSLNNRPRKSFGYKAANEIFAENYRSYLANTPTYH